MGLFSFLNKNKQESTAEDSGYYSRTEDDSIAQARSKRASSAGEPAARRGNKEARASDPVLPEKKRARRRLVGAVALALAVAVGLPMLLDAEPKPLATDIAIQIPSKERAPALPAPSEPAPVPVPVPAADTLDQREEIVEPATAAAKPSAPEHKVARAEAAAAAPKPVPKPIEKAPEKAAEKTADKPADKPAEKPAPKLAQSPAQDARALAILEGKAEKPQPEQPAQPRYVLQVAALMTQEKVNELQGRLKGAGINSFTQKATNASGESVIRIRVGPFSKDDAEKMRARLGKLGLAGSMIPA